MIVPEGPDEACEVLDNEVRLVSMRAETAGALATATHIEKDHVSVMGDRHEPGQEVRMVPVRSPVNNDEGRSNRALRALHTCGGAGCDTPGPVMG